jgi:hypothetical protein
MNWLLYGMCLFVWVGLSVHLTTWLVAAYKTGKYWDVLPRRLVSRETNPDLYWSTLKIFAVVDCVVIVMSAYLTTMAIVQLIRLAS